MAAISSPTQELQILQRHIYERLCHVEGCSANVLRRIACNLFPEKRDQHIDEAYQLNTLSDCAKRLYQLGEGTYAIRLLVEASQKAQLNDSIYICNLLVLLKAPTEALDLMKKIEELSPCGLSFEDLKLFAHHCKDLGENLRASEYLQEMLDRAGENEDDGLICFETFQEVGDTKKLEQLILRFFPGETQQFSPSWIKKVRVPRYESLEFFNRILAPRISEESRQEKIEKLATALGKQKKFDEALELSENRLVQSRIKTWQKNFAEIESSKDDLLALSQLVRCCSLYTQAMRIDLLYNLVMLGAYKQALVYCNNQLPDLIDRLVSLKQLHRAYILLENINTKLPIRSYFNEYAKICLA